LADWFIFHLGEEGLLRCNNRVFKYDWV